MLRTISQHRRNAEMTREELEASKLVKFRELVRYASERSPWYAEVIREHGIDVERCVPTDFPPLTKAELRRDFDSIVTDRRITKAGIAEFLTRSKDPNDLFLGEYRVIHTSGSSGEVGYFVFSKLDWTRGTAGALGHIGERIRRIPRRRRRKRGRQRVAFYGAVGGHFGGVTMASAARKGIAKLFVNLGLYEINDPMPETVARLNAFQPDVLTGYTGGLMVLAEKQREGALDIAPRVVSTVGESMGPTEKATLEEAFGCVARNGYGSSEHLGMGVQIPERGTMLLRDDELIYELHEDHCFVTNLFNYTLPLIRYRMSDILRPVEEKTDPSSPYLEIESLVGRSEIMPRFVNAEGSEDFISPHTINEIFVAGVARFQMQLTGEDSFRFLVTLDPSLDDAGRREAVAGVERRLREILDHKGLTNVCFDVTVVDDIPVNPRTRKFQLIVQAA
jgi:phenylacetate-coenzyme A ligase PaaK-like adenylate-forming protein